MPLLLISPAVSVTTMPYIAQLAYALSLMLICLAPHAYGQAERSQYEVREWANFEDGKLPAQSLSISRQGISSLKVVDLDSVRGTMPLMFRAGEAKSETGQYGLQLQMNPPEGTLPYHAGVLTQQVLDRDKLSSGSRALYQADFFLTADNPPPGLAVIAMVAPDKDNVTTSAESTTEAFYRFGMYHKGALYFSYNAPALVGNPTPVFLTDQKLIADIPRPAWHRFAIVFDGPTLIRCFVDGRETEFSPIKEPALRKLVVGASITSRNAIPDQYIDNISIQVSDSALDLPESPYREGWKVSAGTAKNRKPIMPGLASASDEKATKFPGDWLEPAAAWGKAQQDKKPMLVYFYIPGIPASLHLDSLLSKEPAARNVLTDHVCTAIDVDQLAGGAAAKQYGVFKVPTLMVISPDASWYRKYRVSARDTWNDVITGLK